MPIALSALVAGVLVTLGVTFGAGGAEAQAPKMAAPQVIDTSSPFSHDHHMDAEKVGKAMSCNSCH